MNDKEYIDYLLKGGIRSRKTMSRWYNRPIHSEGVQFLVGIGCLFILMAPNKIFLLHILSQNK